MHNQPINKVCAYCKKNPGPNPKNKNLWNGFFDGDTKQHVCWGCHDRHYKKKQGKADGTTYTEFPVPLKMTAPFETK
jgi:hypothetical protein